jgi:low affinity Fe/Cu permease
MKKNSWFNIFAKAAARAAGRPLAFVLALGTIIVWAVTGPLFGFSDTWQLVINTSTTIVTFLMVFLIQNTQNRDSEAVQIKLDELIRATKGAHTALLDLEELDDQHLKRIKGCYEEIASKSRAAMKRGKDDTGTPFVHLDADYSETPKKK